MRRVRLVGAGIPVSSRTVIVAKWSIFVYRFRDFRPLRRKCRAELKIFEKIFFSKFVGKFTS